MALNFDAKLTLDVSEFLASIKKAENAVDGLRKKLAQPMNMGEASGAPTGVKGRQAAAKEVAKTAKEAADDAERNSARQRYALYDVAAAYQQVQEISVAALKAMIGTAAEYERSFVNVARTTEFVSVKIGEAAESMRYSLTELATQIPVSFAGITEIATIGNQLGITQGKLVDFTKTVAEFSTITGISIEQTALSFGRIGELLNIEDEVKPGEDAYAKLGSAIAFAGVKAVATETQIVSVAKEIATTAKMAKFSTPEVVGLATALSSVGIAPEAARGSIIRTFALINEAVGSGGEKLKAYADVAGVAAEDFAKDWSSNGQKAFDSFLSGLQSLSDGGANLDTVLRNLGVKNVRDIQTIQKLGDNYQVYADGIANANKGFEEGAFLSAAYGQIQETVSAKLTIIQNQWNNFLASTGDASFPAIKVLLDIISQVIDRLNEFARNPFGKVVVVTTTIVLALAAAIAAVNAVVALAKASMMAYTTAVQLSAASQVEAGVAAEAMGAKVTKATMALNALKVAGKATLILAGIAAATSAVALLGDAYEKTFNSVGYFTRKAEESLGGYAGMQEALAADYSSALQVYGSEAAVNAAIASKEIVGMTATMQTNSEAAKQAEIVADGYATILGTTVTDSVNDATEAIDTQNIILGTNYDAWVRSQMLQSGSFQEIAGNEAFIASLNEIGFSFTAANEAAKGGEASLMAYYQSLIDASTNAKAAFDLEEAVGLNGGGMFDLTAGAFRRFNEALIGSAQQAYLLGNGLTEAADAGERLAAVPDKFIESTKTLEKARTIWDYMAEVQDKFRTAFDWRYASKNAADVLYTAWKKVSDNFKEAKKAIKELKTTMNALVADRSTLEYQLSIAIKYGDTLRANAIQAELNANADKIAQNKADQAKEVQNASKALRGNSDAAIRNRQTMQGLVTSSMDYLTTLKTTSKDTGTLIKSATQLKEDFMDQGKALGFNAKELALYTKSFDDFIAIIKGTSDKLDVSMKVYLGFDGADAALHKWKQDNKDLTVTVKVQNPDWLAYQAGIGAEELQQYQNAKKAIKDGTRNPAPPAKSWSQIVADFEKKYGKNFAAGGLVTGPGTGTSDSVRANLSNGEFVVNAASVKRVGVGFLNALNNPQGLSMPAQAFNAAASVSGSNVVYLSPDDRALLRAAIDRPVNLYTENAKIAQSANDGNVLLAQRGRN